MIFTSEKGDHLSAYGYSNAWPQPPNHQLLVCLWPCLWDALSLPVNYQLCLGLFLWGGPSVPVISYAYGYSYGVAPAYHLLGMFMAIPMVWPLNYLHHY